MLSSYAGNSICEFYILSLPSFFKLIVLSCRWQLCRSHTSRMLINISRTQSSWLLRILVTNLSQIIPTSLRAPSMLAMHKYPTTYLAFPFSKYNSFNPYSVHRAHVTLICNYVLFLYMLSSSSSTPAENFAVLRRCYYVHIIKVSRRLL